MNKHGKTWHCPAVLTLLACYGLGDFASAKPENQDAPKPPPEKNLQVLDLSSTEVTDAGIKELAGLKDLRWLNLSAGSVTANGVTALRKDMPKCKIVFDQD